MISVGTLDSHNHSSAENGVNIDQLNPSYYSLGVSALSQGVANPLYGNGGVGTSRRQR